MQYPFLVLCVNYQSKNQLYTNVASANIMSVRIVKDIRFMIYNKKNILKAAKDVSKKSIKSISLKINKSLGMIIVKKLFFYMEPPLQDLCFKDMPMIYPKKVLGAF